MIDDQMMFFLFIDDHLIFFRLFSFVEIFYVSRNKEKEEEEKVILRGLRVEN